MTAPIPGLSIAGRDHPALRSFSEVILLSGFSGATVALVRDRHLPFVRKTANRADANASLREQAVRQRLLADTIADCAAMPEVLGEGECDGYYYFDMAFVPSRDAVNFLAHCTFDSVAEFAERVNRLMARLAQSPAIGARPLPPRKALVVEKLDQIVQRAGDRAAAALAPLTQAVACFETLSVERETAVHGDLTFENILVDRRGDLWLIDTIASPFDHYWIDWSKLFQECEGLWHAHRGRPLARGVTWWLRQRFFETATRLDPAYPLYHYVLLGLTFARILPYAQGEEHLAFVEKRVIECGQAALDIFRSR